jgi:hypothetical protein
MPSIQRNVFLSMRRRMVARSGPHDACHAFPDSGHAPIGSAEPYRVKRSNYESAYADPCKLSDCIAVEGN